jgi:hypothetical protein
MGLSVNVVVNKKIFRGKSLGKDHMALPPEEEKLSKLAKKLKVTPIHKFEGRSWADLAEACGLDPEEAAEMQGMKADDPEFANEKWFPPAEGLKTVRGLLAELRKSSKGFKQSSMIIADLEGIEGELEQAERGKALFQFQLLD